jgi:Protein of unknown function (DUF1552)
MASIKTQRRQFLKAMGGAAAASLPFYSLLESSVVQGQNAGRPLRLLMLYSGFGGVWEFLRPPTAAGSKDMALTPEALTFTNSVLEPLKNFSQQMVLIEGLAHTVGLIPLDEANPITSRTRLIGHDRTSASFTTASSMKLVDKDTLPVSQSIDYFLGQKLGGSNAVRSLQVGIGCMSGVSFYDSLSFNESGKRLPGITDPKAVFRQLFGDAPVMGDMAANLHKQEVDIKVVGAVKASADRLRARLAGSERAKLDEHLQALADIESRLSGSSGPVMCGTPTPPGNTAGTDGDSVPEATKLHFDVLTQAFACDRTRFAVADWAINAGELTWIFGKDVTDMHNQVAHVIDAPGETGATARLRCSKLQNWFAARIAELMQRFAETPDGDGTLLDNTLIVWGQDFGEDVHGGLNVPIILLGGAQKKFRMGRYLKLNQPVGADGYTNPTQFVPYNKLLVSIINAFGVEGDTFGSTEFKGALSELV